MDMNRKDFQQPQKTMKFLATIQGMASALEEWVNRLTLGDVIILRQIYHHHVYTPKDRTGWMAVYVANHPTTCNLSAVFSQERRKDRNRIHEIFAGCRGGYNFLPPLVTIKLNRRLPRDDGGRHSIYICLFAQEHPRITTWQW